MDDLPNDAKSKEVVRLWRAWRTVHEMVADRVCAVNCVENKKRKKKRIDRRQPQMVGGAGGKKE